jgi:asparagine synthase (glutamine-hydrolysing)
VYRYFVLTWDARNSQAATNAKVLAERLLESSSAWARAVDEPGLAAFHSGAGGVEATSRDQVTSCETRVLTGRRRGALFGRLFRLGHELEPRGLNEPLDAMESERICDSGGIHLLENYWGRYIAILREGANQGIRVLRDPTGGLPCFMTEYGGVRIIFSDVEACLSLRMLRFSINWRYVASVVPYSALQIRETGLTEVTELQPGERATINGDIEYSLLWAPSEIAARGRITEPALAIAAVRETVKTCVHAWASLHRSVLHNLSGGLDSSIVLGCLRGAPNNPRVTCLHFYSSASDEDEREYARLVAHHMGVELIESDMDPSAVRLERMLSIRLAPKPWFYIYDLVHSPIEARILDERGATASFSGGGGDGLFLQARADLAVADYLRHRGFRPGVFGVALDAARINRTSVWPTLRQGLLRHLRRPSNNMLAEFGDPRSLIPREVYERARNDDSLFHPWIRAAVGSAPGLLWQILSLSVPAPFYDSFGGPTEIERTPVLVSQPLLELCLRIPSYVWITGGRDRAIARKAFADVLPRAVFRRTQKGLIDRYNRRMLDENAPFLREMLLDGMLVKRGLLDRERIASYLAAGSSSASFEYNEVLRQHLCTEIWLRRWTAATTSSGASG